MTDSKITICKDDTRCDNNSRCMPDQVKKDGSYFCDCSSAHGNTVYNGRSCEFSATEYCTEDKTISYSSYCTNGVCAGVYDPIVSGIHIGCVCNTGYSGDFCEFVVSPDEGKSSGTVGSSSPGSTSTNAGSKGNSPVVASMSIVAVVIAIALVTLWVWRRKRLFGQRHEVRKGRSMDPSTDMHLEADGSTCQKQPGMDYTSRGGLFGSKSADSDLV